MSEFCQKWLQKLFYKLGMTTAHHPFIYLFFGICLTVATFFGFFNFSFETSITYLVCKIYTYILYI